MREIIHIIFTEKYRKEVYITTILKLKEHFKRVSDDTFEIKKGVYLKFNENELIIYEDNDEKEAVKT